MSHASYTVKVMYIYIYICRKIGPLSRLGGLSQLTNNIHYLSACIKREFSIPWCWGQLPVCHGGTGGEGTVGVVAVVWETHKRNEALTDSVHGG